ncbi:unnamed protein product [Didymodactylos carnosus]|uniref:Transposase n=1 Tax=Didymodactylos carnosus TaxID=1234261 RepID=A0A814SQF7_9BILA|nr:unnamed protein product [Didymodactylos carnosus]CAF3914946.1 unnamed protein product [Didymodactylos carnosus]
MATADGYEGKGLIIWTIRSTIERCKQKGYEIAVCETSSPITRHIMLNKIQGTQIACETDIVKIHLHIYSSYPLLRIQIVVLMAKLESTTAVRRHLQRENVSAIPSENTMRSLYAKFLETGSVHGRSGRPPSATTEKQDQIAEVLTNKPMNSIRAVSQEMNMSKSVVHRKMRQILGYKPYKIHLTQQIYDEDKDLRVEMVEILLPKFSNKMASRYISQRQFVRGSTTSSLVDVLEEVDPFRGLRDHQTSPRWISFYGSCQNGHL